MNEPEVDKVDEGMKAHIVGHLLIRDVATGQVLINRRDVNIPNKNDKENDAS